MNTHNAYANFPEYDPPRKKFIGSGSKEFCKTRVAEYIEKHPGRTGGVEPKEAPGDPWLRDWPEVEPS